MIPVVVLASGRGSNFEALIHASKSQVLSGVRIEALISDRSQAGALALAKKNLIPAIHVPFPEPGCDLEKRRRMHGERLLKELEKFQPRFLVLAGYMRILPKLVLDSFRDPRGYCRIVNIHPSLLPAFPGVDSYAQAFHYGAKVSGVTVHLVEEGVDTGPICAQRSFSLESCCSEKEVEAQGLKIEHELFPETLNWVLKEEFSIEELPQGRLRVCKS